MNADKIIEEIQKLPSEEKRKVAAFMRRLMNSEEDEAVVSAEEEKQLESWFETMPTFDAQEKG